MNSDKSGGGMLATAAAMLMGGMYQNGRPGGRVPYNPRVSKEAETRTVIAAEEKRARKNEKRKRDFVRHGQ